MTILTETEHIINNIRKKKFKFKNLKFKKKDNLYLFMDEKNNILNQTNNIIVVNNVLRELLDLDFFIEFL